MKNEAKEVPVTSLSFQSPKPKHVQEANQTNKEERKKWKWKRKAAAGTAIPIAPGAGQLEHRGTLLRSSSETDLTGSKTKWCTQKPWGFFNKKQHTAEIYLSALQCQRQQKIIMFKLLRWQKHSVQRTRQVSLNTKVNVRSTSLPKASTAPTSVCVF